MSPIFEKGPGRHRRTWRSSRKRRKKLPSSFPLVALMLATIIAITVVGFLLNPTSPKASKPTPRPTYSVSPSEEGTETPRVMPTSKPSESASKPSGSTTPPVVRKPSPTPTRSSTTPKPTSTRTPTPTPTSTPPQVITHTWTVTNSDDAICQGKPPLSIQDKTQTQYWAHDLAENPETAYKHLDTVIDPNSVFCPLLSGPS